MNLSDLAARLRQTAEQLQRDGKYDPAKHAIAVRKPNGRIEFGGYYLEGYLYPVLLDARERGVFDPSHLVEFKRRIDPTNGGYPAGPALLGVLDELQQRGFNCWATDPNRGAVERVADAFNALATEHARPSVVLPGALPHSAPSNQYLQEMTKRVESDPATAALMLRFPIENPSIQGMPTTDAWVNCFREWMTLPAGTGTIEGMRGEIARATLRKRIRQLFPIRSLHYQMLAVKADDSVRIIQEAHNPDPEKLAVETLKAYGEARWLDDPAIPDPPAEAALTQSQAMAAMTRLGNWLKSRAAEIGQDSTSQHFADKDISRDALMVQQVEARPVVAEKPDTGQNAHHDPRPVVQNVFNAPSVHHHGNGPATQNIAGHDQNVATGRASVRIDRAEHGTSWVTKEVVKKIIAALGSIVVGLALWYLKKK